MNPDRLDPHYFAQDGARFEVRFERAPEGWLCRIRREGEADARVVAFPDGPGYAADDVRGSLIAGCEAAVASDGWNRPTRH